MNKSTKEQKRKELNEKAKQYYREHREEILAYQKKLREEQKREQIIYSSTEEMIEDWNIKLLHNLQTKKFPQWLKTAIVEQIKRNNDFINEIKNESQKTNQCVQLPRINKKFHNDL
jgi:hypothetical protein